MSDTPKSNAERIQAWRARLRQEGAQQVSVMLPADAVAALREIQRRTGATTQAEVISEALLAHKPRRRKK